MTSQPRPRCAEAGCGLLALRHRKKCWRHFRKPRPLRVCDVDGCERLAGEGPRCHAHEKQLQRKGRVGPIGAPLGRPSTPPLSPREELLQAAVLYADASAEDDGAFDKALGALLRASQRFTLAEAKAGRASLPVRVRADTPGRGEEGTPGEGDG